MTAVWFIYIFVGKSYIFFIPENEIEHNEWNHQIFNFISVYVSSPSFAYLYSQIREHP